MQAKDGGYIVAGDTESFSAGYRDILILKLKENGDIDWQRTIDRDAFNSFDGAHSIVQTEDGGYIVAGETESFGPASYAAWVLKLKPNGDIDWQRAIDGGRFDYARSIVQTKDGGYIVAGNTNSFSERGYGYNVWILKLSAEGNIGNSCHHHQTNKYGSQGEQRSNHRDRRNRDRCDHNVHRNVQRDHHNRNQHRGTGRNTMPRAVMMLSHYIRIFWIRVF